MPEYGDVGTFADAEFTEFGALVFTAAQLGHAQVLAAFGAAQGGAVHFMFLMRVFLDTARAKKHRFLKSKPTGVSRAGKPYSDRMNRIFTLTWLSTVCKEQQCEILGNDCTC